MKKILLIMLFSITYNLFGQTMKEGLPINDETGKISYEEVVEIEGSSKDELYERGREWFIKNFESAKDVLQLEDKENGKLIGQGNTTISIKSLGIIGTAYLYYTIKIYSKEGRYKYIITDYYINTPPNQYDPNPQKAPAELVVIDYLFKKNGKYRPINKQYNDAIQEHGKNMIENIKAYMSKTPEVQKDEDDW